MSKVTIVYPTDPLGVVPGGTDTCIRDILRCAPSDIQMQLVGVTTDPVNYPVGQWSVGVLNGKSFRFYPLMGVRSLERQMKIPLSAKFTLRLFFKKMLDDSDVVQFNRVEPVIAMINLKKPKVLIIHQNMNVLRNKNSEIRWKYLPAVYFWFERFIISRIQEVFIVREDAVVEYQQRFPQQKEHIHFLPTWMNPALFQYDAPEQKIKKRAEICAALNIPANETVMIFVGRFDHQKDPVYLIDSFAEYVSRRGVGQLVLVGDGVLRSVVEAAIKRHCISNRVHLLGALPQETVATFLRASDILLLSSAYEGMPRCVVESLGCGVPVVSTKAGEVSLLINQGKNGYLVENKCPKEFADAIEKTVDNLDDLKGTPCLEAVEQYRAEIILGKLYETYRNYAGK